MSKLQKLHLSVKQALFVKIIVPIFFCEQDNLLCGQFWAMGRFNLLGGQSNLLDGQKPTKLTSYLPPWDAVLHLRCTVLIFKI